MSSARSSNVLAQVVAADAERDRAHEHGDQPVALGRQRDRRRRRSRTRRRARTATAGAPGSPALRGISAAASRPIAIPNAKPSVTSWSTNCHHTKSSWPATTARNASTAGSASPSLRPGLEVERVAHDARHARVGDHRRREHRVGRREQRAEQEALGPAEIGQRVRGDRDDHARQRHRHHELAQRQPPGRLQHLGLDLEPVAEQDHDQRDDRQVVHEARARVDLEHAEAAVAEQEAGEHEGRGQRQERAVDEAGGERAAPSAAPPRISVATSKLRGGDEGHVQ